MGFKKIILVLPIEGYTGETVEHKVTATNLKNQPELVEAGIKEGETIKVMPQIEEPIKQDKTDVKPVAENKSKKRAAEIAEKLGIETVFENIVTGEFFSSDNLAFLSVSGDKNKVKTHNF